VLLHLPLVELPLDLGSTNPQTTDVPMETYSTSCLKVSFMKKLLLAPRSAAKEGQEINCSHTMFLPFPGAPLPREELR